MQKLLADRLRGHAGQYEALVSKDVAAFNELLRGRNIATIGGRASARCR